MRIDKMRTQQIFINLISNAIKFSKASDRITVEICQPELIDEEQEKWKYTFRVSDQGMGLNQEDRKNIFKRFFRSSSEENRNANSSSNGIGLNICKRLAQVLEGDLTLSDTYLKGCQFVLEMALCHVDIPFMMQT